jgi:mannose/cellobiose epimerase-like protein (N-acyl-D-glucosamine 2-epimerase family)
VTLRVLADWFLADALPNWATAGFDAEHGQFREGLALDGGRLASDVVRTRSAARQIYVYAHAATLGVGPADGLSKAEAAFQHLDRLAWQQSPAGFAAAVDVAAGHVSDERLDLYDHACVLLALAWLYRATGARHYLDRADDTLAAMDRTLASAYGGWSEDQNKTLPRRQNPHMHCFEALLALAEACGEARFVARAGELFGLFRTRFLDEDVGTLREFFGADWLLSPSHGSDRLEPGHMAEWVWLLRRYERLAGRRFDHEADTLLRSAVTIGRAKMDGPFIADEVDPMGTPLKDSRRLWPQAELLKALLRQHVALGEAAYLDQAERLACALLETYLADTPAGTWRDCFTLDGRPIASFIPASSNYHLWTAVVEILDLDVPRSR